METHISNKNKLEAVFGDPEKYATTINRLATLKKKDGFASAFAADFHLITVDIGLNYGGSIMNFHQGHKDYVKYFLMTVPRTEFINTLIQQAMQCNNHILERTTERRGTISSWTLHSHHHVSHPQ